MIGESNVQLTKQNRLAKSAKHKVAVKWLRGMTKRNGRESLPNDLNGSFIPFLSGESGKGKGKAAIRETDTIDRDSISLVGLKLTKDGKITHESKKLIALLGLGFTMQEKELRYNNNEGQVRSANPDSTISI